MEVCNMKTRKGIICFAALLTAAVCTGGYALYSYNKANFSGIVTEKYQLETPFHSINVKSNHIVIDSWFGEKDFCVEDDIYADIEVGGEYSFQKHPHINWVSLK